MLRKVLIGLVVLLLLALVVPGGLWLWLSRSGLPERAGEHHLTGLSAPADVRFDRWGVPHVEARSSRDLAAALGYLHANDRFLQMELGRRLAAGRLAELFGPPLIGRDQYSRTLRLYRAAEESWKAAGPETRALLTSYAQGVNAWLAERDGDLPPALAVLGSLQGIDVEPWTPVDSLAFVSLMTFDLGFPAGIQEETRFQWLSTLGPDATADLVGGPKVEAAPEILELARRAGGVGRGAAEPPGTPGSNAWAVGGSRTATGSPLVANDPHLMLGLPGTWYQVMLRSPDYEAAGMTLPGLPVVVVGQNRHLAWAVTNSMLDMADVYFEELDATGSRVRRGDGWAPIREERGTIVVRGGEPVTSRLRSTDRGPLLAAEPERGLPARSLRWTLFERGDSFGALFKLGRARSLDEIPPVIADYLAPSQNLIVAHRDGGMLSTVLGRLPLRRGGDGRLPEPAWRPDVGWDGLRPQATNPGVVRPADDVLVSANEDSRTPGYALPWSGDFDLPDRAMRIREILLARKGWTADDCAAMQTDVVSLFARRIVRLLAGTYTGDAARAYKALEPWDGSMAPQGPSALYALVERELGSALFGDEAEKLHLAPVFSRERVLRALEGGMSPTWLDDVSTPGIEDRQAILARALGRAWGVGATRWGSDVGQWRYGDLHSLVLQHPLGRVPYVGRLFNRGFFPVGGSATTIAAFNGVWRQETQPVLFGPSMRWVADTANPDRSLAIVLGGQSEHLNDAHYDDQIAPFLRGELHAVQWSEAAIEQATVSRLRLRP